MCKDTLSPPSEMETHSDNTSTSDPAAGDLEAPVKRSTSFKERNKSEIIAELVNKRRNSDIELQVKSGKGMGMEIEKMGNA